MHTGPTFCSRLVQRMEKKSILIRISRGCNRKTELAYVCRNRAFNTLALIFVKNLHLKLN